MGLNEQREACTLCGQQANVKYLGPLNQQISYQCPNCGGFSVSDEFKDRRFDAFVRVPMDLLSGYVREMNELGQRLASITSSNWEDIINNPIVPKSTNEKFSKLLQYVHRKTSYFKEPVKLYDGTQPAICYAKNQDEFINITDDLVYDGYLQSDNMLTNREYWITQKGEQYLSQHDNLTSTSKSVFVAMRFTSEMDSVYNNAIKPAIESPECGSYKAFRVDKLEFNDDITDMIMSGINQSRFTVADLTGYRGGVYYEAGYARGLGQQVILTCNKDWQHPITGKDDNGQPVIVQEGVHFDLNHLNIIFWNNEEDLKTKLIERITKTIK